MRNPPRSSPSVDGGNGRADLDREQAFEPRTAELANLEALEARATRCGVASEDDKVEMIAIRPANLAYLGDLVTLLHLVSDPHLHRASGQVAVLCELGTS